MAHTENQQPSITLSSFYCCWSHIWRKFRISPSNIIKIREFTNKTQGWTENKKKSCDDQSHRWHKTKTHHGCLNNITQYNFVGKHNLMLHMHFIWQYPAKWKPLRSINTATLFDPGSSEMLEAAGSWCGWLTKIKWIIT